MNSYSQQSGNYQGQQGYQNQGTSFTPSGYVQSHYNGQLSNPTFGQENHSIVSNQPHGYSYSQTGQQHIPVTYTSYTQPSSMQNGFQSHQPVQSHAQSPALAFGNVGPVIAHVGYQAGSDAQHSQHSFYQPSHAAFHYGGMTPTHSNTPLHPVYEATNAYQQAGPVISQLGYQANSAVSNPYYGGQR